MIRSAGVFGCLFLALSTTSPAGELEVRYDPASDRLEIRAEHVPAADLFAQLERETGVHVRFPSARETPVSLRVEGQPLESGLRDLASFLGCGHALVLGDGGRNPSGIKALYLTTREVATATHAPEASRSAATSATREARREERLRTRLETCPEERRERLLSREAHRVVKGGRNEASSWERREERRGARATTR